MVVRNIRGQASIDTYKASENGLSESISQLHENMSVVIVVEYGEDRSALAVTVDICLNWVEPKYSNADKGEKWVSEQTWYS